jgi:hypothetical protein
MLEKFVDTKGVTSCKLMKDRQHNKKGQTVICKILHRKLNIQEHDERH